MIYLDWAATSKPDEAILSESLAETILFFANPSSQHEPGKKARELLESSRKRMLEAIQNAQGKPSTKIQSGYPKLIFTASGTEADQIPILALLHKKNISKLTAEKAQRPHMVISAIEHAAIHSQVLHLQNLGFEVSFVQPDSEGFIHPSAVTKAIRPSTVLVAVMLVNNETGAIQDISGIGQAIEETSMAFGIKAPWFHIDCVQALGKIPFSLPYNVSSAAFSAHKIGGPKGIGALMLFKELIPLAQGGGQESGYRSGTENVAGIDAFSRCVQKSLSCFNKNLDHAHQLEQLLINGLLTIPGCQILPASRCPGESRFSPWIVSASFPGLSGEVLQRALSKQGICVSTGSACASSHGAHVKKGRRILDAMGITPEASFCSIRISIGVESTEDEIRTFIETAHRLYISLKT